MAVRQHFTEIALAVRIFPAVNGFYVIDLVIDTVLIIDTV